MLTAVRRKTDGLLVDIQAMGEFPTSEQQQKRLQNAIQQIGGTVSNWEVYLVPNEVWIGINTFARQFATIAEGAITGITQSTPPSVNPNKVQIQNDGVDQATIQATISDASYTGAVKWMVIAPDGSVMKQSENAVAGAASLALTTTQEGIHRVVAETELHGIAQIEIEGV